MFPCVAAVLASPANAMLYQFQVPQICSCLECSLPNFGIIDISTIFKRALDQLHVLLAHSQLKYTGSSRGNVHIGASFDKQLCQVCIVILGGRLKCSHPSL
uniref:Uncharacterized protein n=1 Tax=Fusarium oxysporum (strain Fo5176) TaxID=660025 RepID=A0A0D2XUH7_FUSOF